MNILNINKTVSLIGRLLDSKKPTVPVLDVTPQKPEFAPVQYSASFAVSTPEAAGIPSAVVNDFLRSLYSDKTLNMHNIIMYRNGRVFCNAEFGAYTSGIQKCTFSECKSIVSLAVGLLIDEGRLKLGDKIIDIFSDECNAIIRLKLKDLTIENLLTMTSGILFNEVECMSNPDWVRCFLRSAVEESGKKFSYNSLNTYMLSAVVCRISGRSLSEYLDEKLFKRMGISGYYWETCPKGIEKGGWGLYIRPDDILKLGVLVMQNGMWDGEQLISSEYITAATTLKAVTPSNHGDFNYGYQIWTGRDSDTFLFNGMFGQNVLGFKNNGIIIVSNAGNDELFQQSSYYKYVLDYFRGDFSDSLPQNRKEFRDVQHTLTEIRKITHERRSILSRLFNRRPYEKQWQTIDGVQYAVSDEKPDCAGLLPVIIQAVQNNYCSGVQSIEFNKQDGIYYINYTEQKSSFKIPVGFEKKETAVLRFGGEPYVICSTGRFAYNEYDQLVLIVDIHFIETPCTRTLKFIFSGNAMSLLQTERPGKPTVDMNIKFICSGLSEKPIISTVLEKLDDDYSRFRLQRLFAPELNFTKKEINEKNI